VVQHRTPVSVTRLYTGSDGEAHAEGIADARVTPAAAARNGALKPQGTSR
jgi:hypothetical protein